MPKANDSENENVTFKSLGLCDELCEACERLEWKKPTDIQKESIPLALKGHDLIGVSETGSGKTAAYALPIIHDLLQKPRRFFALILTPTRELAEQVADQFDALGAHIKIRCSVIIGGEDTKAQVLSLARKPHIIIATPGRLVDHLRGTKGFTLDPIKYLVFDEADRMLNDNFEEEINVILRRIPEKRQTYLFSATMTCKVKKLEKASLKNPVKLEVSSKYQTVSTLKQKVIVVPEKYKEYYLCYLARQLSRLEGTSTIIFCGDWHRVRLFSVMFRLLDISAVALYGKMSQEKRNSALNKFKERTCPIMLATDLASRGLDIPSVDYVIVFDVPNSPKTYIHRVGRTARAGRSGTAYTFVTQFDMLDFPKIEKLLGFTMDEYAMDQGLVLSIKEDVDKASRTGKMEVRELERLEKKRKNQDDVDEEEGAGGGSDAGGASEDVKKTKKKFFKRRKFGKK